MFKVLIWLKHISRVELGILACTITYLHIILIDNLKNHQ